MESTAASTRFHQPHMERKMSAMTCEIFNELRLEGKLCDVVIKVNGFEFNAHKNILCSCSSYFRYNTVARLSQKGTGAPFETLVHFMFPTPYHLKLGTLSNSGFLWPGSFVFGRGTTRARASSLLFNWISTNCWWARCFFPLILTQTNLWEGWTPILDFLLKPR